MNTAETIQAEAVTITDAAALAGSSTSNQWISDWRLDFGGTSHSVVFQHSLGKIPTSLLVLFSQNLETVFPIQWSWYRDSSGNPVTISMDSRVVTLEIFKGAPLHGTWTANPEAWTSYSSGYWRVIASV
jgi:hypothetical protein